MKDKSKHIVILGAGISGLATAHWLSKENYKVTVLESSDQVGGSMRTETIDDFLVDFGPNSGLETSPYIKEIVEDIGLSEEMIYANTEASKRYILKSGKLIALPMNPASFIKTSLFSTTAKLRLLKEPFVGRSKDGYYQSIAEFVRRRLGNEFLDYAIDPFVSGVFAGDPEKLSVKSAFPKLYRLEELYGGLIKGMIKGAKERRESKKRNEDSKQSAKMFSFKSGMQIFPDTIAKNLGDSVKSGSLIKKVIKENGKYKVLYSQDGKDVEMTADIIMSTIPAYKASSIFNNIDNELSNHLDRIYYPTVKVLYLAYKKDSINVPLDGFGFLIPSKEKQKFLGSIWSSTIFPNRAPEGFASFTMFIGGAKSGNLFDENAETLEKEILSRFHSLMQISSEPVLKVEKKWDKAIPQYNLGHVEHDMYFEKFEIENPGLFLGGNYRGGISVGDCIKNSHVSYEKIRNYISK